jgi:GTPase
MDQTANFKSGFVAVMGRPNVGKSTLVNALLQQKVAAVSARPQTTRKRQMGILTLENAQIIFVDTPGIHQARHKLGENMNQNAAEALKSCDAVIFLVDISQRPGAEDRTIAGLLSALKRPGMIILAGNKVDIVEPQLLEAHLAAYLELLPGVESLVISARRDEHLDELLEKILSRLKPGAPYFPADQTTDLYERDIAADLIREATLIMLREEVPHGIAVRIDEFTERGDNGAYIEATLFVEREAHKPIVIGQGGMMLKKIGSAARHEIETMSGRKVFLSLRVKVRKDWRDDDKVLQSFGY